MQFSLNYTTIQPELQANSVRIAKGLAGGCETAGALKDERQGKSAKNRCDKRGFRKTFVSL